MTTLNRASEHGYADLIHGRCHHQVHPAVCRSVNTGFHRHHTRSILHFYRDPCKVWVLVFIVPSAFNDVSNTVGFERGSGFRKGLWLVGTIDVCFVNRICGESDFSNDIKGAFIWCHCDFVSDPVIVPPNQYIFEIFFFWDAPLSSRQSMMFCASLSLTVLSVWSFSRSAVLI